MKIKIKFLVSIRHSRITQNGLHALQRLITSRVSIILLQQILSFFPLRKDQTSYRVLPQPHRDRCVHLQAIWFKEALWKYKFIEQVI